MLSECEVLRLWYGSAQNSIYACDVLSVHRLEFQQTASMNAMDTITVTE